MNKIFYTLKHQILISGADPGYVKRGGVEIQKGGPGGWYNPKITQKLPKIGWISMIYLSKGGAGADSDHTWIRPWIVNKIKAFWCIMDYHFLKRVGGSHIYKKSVSIILQPPYFGNQKIMTPSTKHLTVP